MSDTILFEKCQTYIDCHTKSSRQTGSLGAYQRLPSITISRLTGAGGLSLGERLVTLLQARAPKPEVPWTVFDKNLVEKVLDDHHLPQSLAKFMPEDRMSAISDAMEELLGLHPPSWKLVAQTTETMLKLAELGHAILIGRAANIITAKIEHVLHVRLVASLETRVQRVQKRYDLSKKAALAFIEKEDAGRVRYVKRYFKQNIDDPLLYHLVINTDWFPLDQTAELIAQLVSKKYE
jgi:hypothetical protein